MYGIYANMTGVILSILMGSMLPYIAYMDPMGYRYPTKDVLLKQNKPHAARPSVGPATKLHKIMCLKLGYSIYTANDTNLTSDIIQQD